MVQPGGRGRARLEGRRRCRRDDAGGTGKPYPPSRGDREYDHRAESCMKEKHKIAAPATTLGSHLSHLSSVAARPDVEYHSRSMRGDPITMVTVIAGTQFATTRRGYCSGTTLVDTIRRRDHNGRHHGTSMGLDRWVRVPRPPGEHGTPSVDTRICGISSQSKLRGSSTISTQLLSS